MSDNPIWLDRLDHATNYRELQDIFSDIAASVESGGDHAELARNIDEAIRRLVAERASDERDLQEVQLRYDSFREQNKGVVGWFKRHIPFTATRRQEGELKGDLAQQSAEILADNLVIARAQMLKERFLGPEIRKLGRRAADWRVRLESAAAEKDLAPLGRTLQELDAELGRSRVFLNELKQDLDAFADAAFKTPEDRQRRDEDLAAARHELAELTQETDAEGAMRQSGLKHLGTRVVTELDATDPAFQADGRQLEKLRGVLGRVDEARNALGQLVAAVTPLAKLFEEMRGIPAKTQELRHKLAQLERQLDDANAAEHQKSTIFAERGSEYEAARRDVEQTQQLQANAQQFYDAWLAENRDDKSMSIPVEAPPDSPMLRRLNEAKAAAAAAQARLANATPPYERAKKEAEAAQSARQELTRQRDAQRESLDALERRAPLLKLDLISGIDRTHIAFAAAASAFSAYLSSDRAASAAPLACYPKNSPEVKRVSGPKAEPRRQRRWRRQVESGTERNRSYGNCAMRRRC